MDPSDYKNNLLSTNEELQYETIDEIVTRLYEIDDPIERTQFAEYLVNTEVTWIICHFVKTSDHGVIRSALMILQAASHCCDFYGNNIARRAITYILQKGNELAETGENHHKLLLPICNTLSIFFNGALDFKVPLHRICNINATLQFLNELNLTTFLNPLYILAVVNFYAALIPHIDELQHGPNLNIILEVHESVLSSTSNIIRNYYDINDMMIEEFMRPILIICKAVMRMPELIARDATRMSVAVLWANSNPLLNPLEPMFKITYKTLVDIVIPHSISINVTREIDSVSSLNFLYILCELYKRLDVDLSEVSCELTKFGYLKYFHKMLDASKSYQARLCDLIARILADMTPEFLAMNTWRDGIDAFRQFIAEELLSLNDFTIPDDGAPMADSLLYLIYVHLLGSQDFRITEFISVILKIDLVRKIKDLPNNVIPELPTLQVILFLYSMSTLCKPLAITDETFYTSLIRNTSILREAGVRCYCQHNRQFPLLVAKGRVIPTGIANDVMKIYLKYNNNFYLLFISESNGVFIDCILNIFAPLDIEQEHTQLCTCEFVDVLDSCVEPTYSITEQIIQGMWANFPRVMHEYFRENQGSAIALYLDFIAPLESLQLLKKSTIIESSHTIIEILLRNDHIISIHSKILLVELATVMLNFSLLSRDHTVVWMYVNNYPLLHKISTHAFNKNEGEELSTVSFECLSAILRSQKELSTACYRPAILKQTALFGPLYPRQSSHTEVLDFYDRMWDSEIDRPAVVIEQYTKNEFKDTLIEIYRMYCRIHMDCDQFQWEYNFHFLTNFLKYLKVQNKSALIECCEYIGNSDIIIMAVKTNYWSFRCINFVSTWINLSFKRRIPSAIAVLNTRNIRKEMKERNCCEPPFLKTLYEIDEYIKKAIKLDLVDKHFVMDLVEFLNDLL